MQCILAFVILSFGSVLWALDLPNVILLGKKNDTDSAGHALWKDELAIKIEKDLHDHAYQFSDGVIVEVRYRYNSNVTDLAGAINELGRFGDNIGKYYWGSKHSIGDEELAFDVKGKDYVFVVVELNALTRITAVKREYFNAQWNKVGG